MYAPRCSLVLLAWFIAVHCSFLPSVARAQVRPAQLIGVYQQSKKLASEGHIQDAIKLLERNISYPDSRNGPSRPTVLSETNARLLAFMAELLQRTAKNEADLFDAETYAAAAVNAARCESTYWKTYVAIRLQRETYAPFVNAMQRGEATCYPDHPLKKAKPHFSCLVSLGFYASYDSGFVFPNPNDATLVQAFLYMQQGDASRATNLLSFYKTNRNLCPVNDVLAEYALKAGDPQKALGYLNSVVDDRRVGASAYRMYLFGVALRSTGNIEGARRSFTEALRIDSSLSDADVELRSISWGDTGDPALQKSILTDYVDRFPADWRAWSALWSSQYLHAQHNVQEFAELARAKQKSSNLVAPELAHGLVSLYLRDLSGAQNAVNRASHGGNTTDVVFAGLVLDLLSGDYAKAGKALASLSEIDSPAANRLFSLGFTPSEVQQLRESSTAVARNQTGVILLRLSDVFPDNAYAQTALTVFSRDFGQQNVPGHDIRVDVLWQDRAIQGQIEERRFELTRAQLAQLSLTTLDVLSSQNILRADIAGLHRNISGLHNDVSGLNDRIVFQETQIRGIEALVKQNQADLRASETRLASLIETRDARIAGRLDELAQCTDQLRDSLQSQRLDLDALKKWRDAPPQEVAQKVTSLGDLLSTLSSAISIGPSFGIVSLNLTGILAGLCKALNI